MSNSPDLDHESTSQRLLSRPRIRRTADSRHLQLTIWIQQYNTKAVAAGGGDLDPKTPTEPFEQTLIYEINRIQREINPAIRPWLAYGCGLTLVVFLHIKFLTNTNLQWKSITKPGTLLACFAWSLLAGLVIKSEVTRSATDYIQRTLEFVKELAAERKIISTGVVKTMLGWRWYWVGWKRSPGI